MDGRQVNPTTEQRRQREAPSSSVQLHGFYMVGRREHEDLIAGGHYRCPHCRRADMLENAPVIHGG
jgi:hypothetical protein